MKNLFVLALLLLIACSNNPNRKDLSGVKITKEYWPYGKVKIAGKYVNDKREGLWIEYWPDPEEHYREN